MEKIILKNESRNKHLSGNSTESINLSQKPKPNEHPEIILNPTAITLERVPRTGVNKCQVSGKLQYASPHPALALPRPSDRGWSATREGQPLRRTHRLLARECSVTQWVDTGLCSKPLGARVRDQTRRPSKERDFAAALARPCRHDAGRSSWRALASPPLPALRKPRLGRNSLSVEMLFFFPFFWGGGGFAVFVLAQLLNIHCVHGMLNTDNGSDIVSHPSIVLVLLQCSKWYWQWLPEYSYLYYHEYYYIIVIIVISLTLLQW